MKFKFLDIITVFFVTALLVSNIASSKITRIGPFTFDAGTLLFPITYIFGDILTEVYGYRRLKRVIWLGFFCNIVMALTFIFVGMIPSASFWPHQDAYDLILGITPRIIFASLIAYFIGEFSNSFILAKLKIITKGRYLWTRTIGSTLVGELLDTLLFVFIAFSGIISYPNLILIFISNYIFKVCVEILFTPLTYFIVNKLKKIEKVDYYDYKTNFNPFR